MSNASYSIPEHQSPLNDEKEQDENDPNNYTPDEEEKKILRMVDKLLEEHKNYRQRFDDKWPDYWRMFRGDQWKEKRPSYRHSEVINMIFETLQSQVATITDPRPRIEYLPQEPNDREFAAILNDIAEYDWITGNWGWTYVETVFDSHIFGTGNSSLQFDPEMEEGLGGLDYSSEDCFDIYPCPDARTPNKGGDCFIKATPKSLKYIKKHFKKGKFVKSDIADYNHFDRTDFSQTVTINPNNQLMLSSPGKTDLTADKALLVYCYKRNCEETIKEESVDEMGQPATIERLKYPNGRLIVKAGGVLLSDGPIPYDHGKVPFQRVQNYINPRQYWGISEEEQLEGPQKIFNKLLSFSLDVLTLMGNPIWMIDTDTGIDPDNLINRPGLVVTKEPGTQAVRQEGVQLQPYVLQLIDRLKGWVSDLSGATDVSKGIRPEGANSGYMVDQLMQASQTRLRQKSRNLDYYLQDLGQQYAGMVLQYRTVPKIYRLTAQDGTRKYFKFHVEKVKGEDGNDVTMGRMRNLEEGSDGKYAYGEEKQLQLQGKLDVRVTTGSDLPFNKQANESRGYKLFELQVIDDEELLKQLDYPNREAVLERVRAKKEQAAAAQAAAQGAPPMPAQ